MHTFDDRASVLTIFTAQKPSRTAYRKAPPIVMDPSCGFLHDEQLFAKTREQGYNISTHCEFLLDGKITCSDPNRQVSPALLYYCLTGEAERILKTDPNSPIFLPENARQYLILDYKPSPDDILWKPYKIVLGLDHTLFHFMALDQNDHLLTATIAFTKLAFHFEFNIIFHNRNERENYICRWSPAENTYSYSHPPFHIHYELIFNSDLASPGIAQRHIDYNSHPGLRSPTPIHNIRVYGKEIHVLG